MEISQYTRRTTGIPFAVSCNENRRKKKYDKKIPPKKSFIRFAYKNCNPHQPKNKAVHKKRIQ